MYVYPSSTYMYVDIRYTSKIIQQFVKFVHRFLIRNRVVLLWFVQEAPGYRIAALFAKRATIRRRCRIFMVKGAKDCGALQGGALRRGHQSVALSVGERRRRGHQSVALSVGERRRRGHQSVALSVGERRRTCRHVFKCRHSTFVALLLYKMAVLDT